MRASPEPGGERRRAVCESPRPDHSLDVHAAVCAPGITPTDDLATVVDAHSLAAVPARPRSQVRGDTLLPHEGVLVVELVAEPERAHDLAAVVDPMDLERRATEDPEIRQHSMPPQKGVRLARGRLTLPHDPALVVNRGGTGPGAAECAEVGLDAVVPESRRATLQRPHAGSTPTTCPRMLIEVALLCTPPSVPRLVITPDFQSTAEVTPNALV